MIRIVNETETYSLEDVAASLGTILGKTEQEIKDAITKVTSKKENNRGCSHIFNRGDKAGTRCGKTCNANGLCGSHQPRNKVQKAVSEANLCDAVLKSGQRAGQACGKPSVEDGKCSIHKKVVINPSSSLNSSLSENLINQTKSQESNGRRPNNNLDFDFKGEAIPLSDNQAWWKPCRSTEIDGKVYKQHRSTRLLLINDNQVAGLMVNGKPIWRGELENYVIEWCKKSGLG